MSNRKKAKNRRLLAKRAFKREANERRTLIESVDIPEDEKQVLRIVPAKADGVVIGEAIIYDDGSVDVKVFDDAPEEAVAKLKQLEKEMMFGIEDDDGLS